MSDELKTPDEIALNDAATRLSQHFDSVRIFVTRFDGEHTLSTNTGRGNWYAQYGQIREWIVRADERSRMNEGGVSD